MSKKLLKTETDIRDFVRGCTFYGTGGGGLPENGVKSLMAQLKDGKEIGWIDVNEIPDDAYVACTFLMGSIAPLTPEVKKEMEGFGLIEPKYTDNETLSEAIKELSQYTGKEISAIVPIELGGANTPGGIAAALINDIPVVDGDYTGRAIPEIQQTTPYINGKALWPISSVDLWGNVCIIKDGINYRMIERIGKILSVAAYSMTGDVGFLMTGKEMKESIIQGTLTECYEIGKLIRETYESNEDPIKAIVEKLDGFVLIEGKVIKKETEDKAGYYWGINTIKGNNKFEDEIVKVWFKNENHVAWKNDKVIATSPDIITIVEANTGEPIANPTLKEGDEVAVLGFKARDIFRTKKGIDILGPRYFDFNFDYIPIEDLNE